MLAGVTVAEFFAVLAGLVAPLDPVFVALDPVFAAVDAGLALVFGLVGAGWVFVGWVTWASTAVDNRTRNPRICSG